MKTGLFALAVCLSVALVLVGCVGVQPTAQAPTALPSQQVGPSASPSAAPSVQSLQVDPVLRADPIYLRSGGTLFSLAKVGASVSLRVSVVNDTLFLQDYFNPLSNASSRAITNFSQPNAFAFNILANTSDLLFGSVLVETDLPPRANETSLVRLDMFNTESAYPSKGQKEEVDAYVSSTWPLEYKYDKIAQGGGLVAYIILFPTNFAEPSRGDFDRFYSANKGWHYIRFLDKTPSGTNLVAEIKLLFE